MKLVKMKRNLVICLGLLLLVTPVQRVEAQDNETTVIETNSSTVFDVETFDYTHEQALELAALVRDKKVTSEELVKEAIAHVNKENPSLNAVITMREEEALEEARQLVDTGQPFLGVPLLIKGLGQPIKGGTNTNGLDFLRDKTSSFTGAFVKALQEAGFIVIGQTNYPQLGLTNITDSTLYGPTGSPWNPNYQAGGSSGGAGASVASGMVPIASGSDAGGSIRIPASWNGVIGLKPSRGAIKGSGNSEKNQVVHFANTSSMADTEALLDVLKQPGAEFHTPVVEGTRIAYSTKSPVGTPVSEDAIHAIESSVAFLREKGFTVDEVDTRVDGVMLMKQYYTIGAGSGSLAGFLAQQALKRPMEIGDVDLLTWTLYQTGKVTTKEEVEAAWTFNHQAAQTMAEFHETYPIYLTPTTAYTAPSIGQKLVSDAYEEKMRHMDDMTPEERKQLIYDQWLESLTLTPFTQQANLTGEPAISLPTYVSKEGLPLGIQLNAKRGDDYLLIEFGKLFEEGNQLKRLIDVTDTGQTENSASSDEKVESSTIDSIISGTTETSELGSTDSATAPIGKPSSDSTIIGETSTGQVSSSTTDSGGIKLDKQNKEKTGKWLPKLNEQSAPLGIGVGVTLIGCVFILSRRKR
ncbi:MAG: amidase family protein [Vagococcus sp.]